jgi:hypothetical protein
LSLTSRAGLLATAAAVPFALVLSVLLSGCSDSVGCVFVQGCQGGGGGIGPGGTSAVFPRDGLWISNVPPEITRFLPDGAGPDSHSATPIVLEFSESMVGESLAQVFQLVPIGGNIIGDPVPFARRRLLGDGRLLVFFPETPLDPGSYVLRVRDDFDPPTDITGQTLELTPGDLIGPTFIVGATDPAEPTVLATWPAQGDQGAGDMSEFVVVFDRQMNELTVNGASFNVTENGMDPLEDPGPEVLTFSEFGPEPRVFTWRSEDPLGVPSPLMADADIELGLSPLGAAMLDQMGGLLPPTTFMFGIGDLATPLASSILSQPSDAIGTRNITADGDEDLTIQVDLLDAQEEDVLEVFMFGTQPGGELLVALRRELVLTGPAPIQVGTFTLPDLDFTVGGDPTQPRFADGEVGFAFRLRRNLLSTQLMVMDVDTSTPDDQGPLLDTVPPSILALDFSGTTTTATASPVRDVVLVGDANEVIRSVEVAADDGMAVLTNGTLPPVVGSDLTGRFVSAPVPLGVLAAGTATFTAIAYDAAFNASDAIAGTFTQLGAVGPGAFAPGDPVSVQVFDASTLLPLEDALVLVHTDTGAGVDPMAFSTGLTGADGWSPALATSALGVGALVTVDLPGYDLFTFHGITSGRLSVPLDPTGGGTAQVLGAVTSTDPAIAAILPGLSQRLDDTRRLRGEPRTYLSAPCTTNPDLACDYGPEPILAGRLGVQTFFAGDFMADEMSFNAALVLQAFCLSVPLGPVDQGVFEDTTFELPFLLIDASVVPEEKPDELTQVLYRGDLTLGIDLGNLVGDPETTGEPLVTVETIVPGVGGTTAVGPGLAFDQGGSMWNVRSARPGAVSPMGFFGLNGTVDTDLFLRCEMRDLDGNVSASRPRLSHLPMLGDTLFSANVPVLTSPVPLGDTGGPAYDIRFDDTLPDAAGMEGLYRVDLSDAFGRGWTLWRPDAAGGAEVGVHVPDIGLDGGVGLLDGTITVVLSSYGWVSLDTTGFLWTDVEREANLLSHSAATTFQQTP